MNDKPMGFWEALFTGIAGLVGIALAVVTTGAVLLLLYCVFGGGCR
jgi:hypothetical protein